MQVVCGTSLLEADEAARTLRAKASATRPVSLPQGRCPTPASGKKASTNEFGICGHVGHFYRVSDALGRPPGVLHECRACFPTVTDLFLLSTALVAARHEASAGRYESTRQGIGGKSVFTCHPVAFAPALFAWSHPFFLNAMGGDRQVSWGTNRAWGHSCGPAIHGNKSSMYTGQYTNVQQVCKRMPNCGQLKRHQYNKMPQLL